MTGRTAQQEPLDVPVDVPPESVTKRMKRTNVRRGVPVGRVRRQAARAGNPGGRAGRREASGSSRSRGPPHPARVARDRLGATPLNTGGSTCTRTPRVLNTELALSM